MVLFYIMILAFSHGDIKYVKCRENKSKSFISLKMIKSNNYSVKISNGKSIETYKNLKITEIDKLVDGKLYDFFSVKNESNKTLVEIKVLNGQKNQTKKATAKLTKRQNINFKCRLEII